MIPQPLILLLYCAGAGGKFIEMCLSISGQCIPQHPVFPKLFVSPDLGQKKIGETTYKYTKKELKWAREANAWNDFGVGCVEFFGSDLVKVHHGDYDVDVKLLTEEYYQFLVIHSRREYDNIRNFFVDKHFTINFVDQDQFFKLYRPKRNVVKPFTHEQLHGPFFDYRVDAILDENEFVSQLKDLYNVFELTNFREDLILDLREDYLSTLVTLNSNYAFS